MKVFDDTKIYIVAPAGTATGGPELLHQLCFHLRNDLNLDAYMFYQPTDHPDPVHSAYKVYGVPYVDRVDDKEENIIIVPEVVRLMEVIDDYKNIRKVIWWLSVDNFYISKMEKESFLAWRNRINRLLYLFLKRELFELHEIAMKIYKDYDLSKDKLVTSADLHLAQSYYALDHLRNHGIKNVEYLSDYLNKSFLEKKPNLKNKKDKILYNPKKGYIFTSKLIKEAEDLNFIPIENMTREEVIKALEEAKVYIDFGNHPGKDRLPREAAILGCCVIVGCRGSASGLDVPIPQEFKFKMNPEPEIDAVIGKLRDCIENFHENHKKFDNYRKIIMKEPVRFREDLKKIFSK